MKGEEISYSECLQRYVRFINGYKNIFIFGAGIYGIRAAKILKEKLPDKEYYFIDNDKAKQGQVLYDDIQCFGTEWMSKYKAEEALIIIAAINSRNAIYSSIRSDKTWGVFLE